MANTTAICDSFRVDLLNGLHAFGTTVIRAGTTKDTFNIALYLASASKGKTTAIYDATGEIGTSGDYSAGGKAVTNATAPANTGGTNIVAFWTPSANIGWTGVTWASSFDAALLYNATSATKLAVAVFNFGAQTVTGNFTLTMPTNDLSTGLIRIA